jgi:hypothetical protein
MEFRCWVNADFAGAKICPVADNCQSSDRTLQKNREVIFDQIFNGQSTYFELKIDLLRLRFGSYLSRNPASKSAKCNPKDGWDLGRMDNSIRKGFILVKTIHHEDH